MSEVIEKAQIAKEASILLNILPKEQKNKAILQIANNIKKYQADIIKSNEIDIRKGHAKNMSKALIDRLSLDQKRILAMAESTAKIAELDDAMGEVIQEFSRPNGLKIRKVRAPFGVIAMIYESRPNVTLDAFILCFKVNSVVILKGGSDAINSNKKIVEIIKLSLKELNLNQEFVQLIEDQNRQAVVSLLKQKEFIDLVIPRGGAGLINAVKQESTIPVIETGTGNCHIYVDNDADLDKALLICENAKVQRPSVCNATEKILVHKDIANLFLPKLKQVFDKNNVEMRVCDRAKKILKDEKIATDSDWETEYLDLIIAIKIVDNIDMAINHINFYGSKHTDAIITEDTKKINKFEQLVDSSTVISNASTRFTDGGEFGFGAEIGISTQKLHARGPMGLKEITSYKYLVTGSGQIRN